MGLNYLVSQIKSGGSFGHSTQATVLALQALIKYKELNRDSLSCHGCQFELLIDGDKVETVTYNETAEESTKVEFSKVTARML